MLATNRKRSIGLFILCLLFMTTIWMSIIYGYTDTNWKNAIEAFTNNNGSNAHIIIETVRLPRALIAAAVGASLAMAGALMQALTKNPLASPGIFGINAGAGFFIVLFVTFFQVHSLQIFTWLAFSGAALAAAIVFIISAVGKDGATPLKLTLAGTAVAALFASLTQGMLAANEKALEEVLFWLAGSIAGRKLEMLTAVLPYFIVGWIGSLLLAQKVNILMMGDDVAKGLGQRTNAVKVGVALLVVLLAGSSVAVAGPIGFIGIIVPHIARALVGVDHRWVLPYCALIGAILLIAADIGARYILMPREVPVGIVTAFLGVPFFIYIARRGILAK
ncbi:iron ABC transporter permease [Geobacillus sp. 44B]|uniref:FecCD family ABC transporter permease n=1 Tax=Saccharococcus caldoxylosilyticus TaxID=81408 RepID=UPI0002EA178E|nr:iron ABC transporter permease [Parageobacillus caldoxylosilyticus]OQP01671.1 iron ABC transporter [Geobacillus sp. 44B]QNU37496.1 iron ABC transporter permease [Geobacillus sp. 44B]QXJ37057.1 putative siderophore transport system permease protein YfiZ precursor [Parageobacillus caldoxylosilyticus]BDG35465.1 siderophore ABC transporter permease [Parageobacillus caldoxylosilyticus]BDG39243.1 siderophore ABC transporter permease [Parageobacillus caldoxylosilyticus]